MSTLEDEPLVVSEFTCPECGKEYSGKGGLDRHRKREHGYEPPPSRRQQRRQTSRASMQEQLAQAHLALCIGAIGVSNPVALANKPAVDYLEDHSKRWAATLAAVCDQDERVMAVVQTAMHAGVWLTFLSATATSVVSVGMMSGMITVPYGAARLLAPELATIAQQAAAAQAAAAAAGSNGAEVA